MRRVSRPLSAFLEEARLLVEVAGLDSIARVCCQAPVNHAFGLQCGLFLSAALGVPFTFLATLGAGLRFAEQGVLLIALPSTWGWLARNSAFLGSSDHLRVLHSGGPLPRGEEPLSTRWHTLRKETFEVFGTTETGAIAFRYDRAAETPWTLFRDVETSPNHDGEEQGLSVRSPRCAVSHRDYCDTGDIVQFSNARQFHHVGRRGAVIKVNGLNLDLEALESRARTAFPDLELQLHRLPDPLRGESFEIWLRSDLVARSPEVARDVLRKVSSLCPDGIAPRRIRRRPSLSWTVSRKTPRGAALEPPGAGWFETES